MSRDTGRILTQVGGSDNFANFKRWRMSLLLFCQRYLRAMVTFFLASGVDPNLHRNTEVSYAILSFSKFHDLPSISNLFFNIVTSIVLQNQLKILTRKIKTKKNFNTNRLRTKDGKHPVG